VKILSAKTYRVLAIAIFWLITCQTGQTGRVFAADNLSPVPSRAILFIIDGLHWQAPQRLNLEQIQNLAKEGTSFEKAYLLMPYHPTSGDWAKLHNCSLPNPIMLAGTLFITPEHRLVQEVFGKIGPTGHAANSESYLSVNRSIHFSMVHGGEDAGAVEFALDLLRKYDPKYIRLHLQQTGSAGSRCSWTTEDVPWRHNIWGEGSPYVGAARNADRLLGEFVQELKAMGKWEETLLVVTSDHGQAYTGWHPLLQEESWVTPLILAGPGVAKGRRLPYAEHIDIIPLICHLMGIEAPNDNGGKGRVLTEIMAEAGDESPLRPQLTLEINRVLREYYTLRARMQLLAEFKDPYLESVTLQASRQIYDLDRFAEWHRAGTLENLLETNRRIVARMKASWESSPAVQPLVGLDYYYNNEPFPHYTWEQQQSPGSYSEFGRVIESLGGHVTSVSGPATAERLDNLAVYMIVDPDTASESPSPNFIEPGEIDAILEWVRQGGVLMLLANNQGNAEFPHFNTLAGKFGIQFDENTAETGASATFEPTAHGDTGKQFLQGISRMHIVGMCTQTLRAPAESVLSVNGQTFMATARLGKGTVLSVSDPVWYDEYIDHQDNRMALINIMKWILARTR
jgi:hypothetical protein